METWLSPYLSSYHQAYGEKPTLLAIKRMAKAFKALEMEYPRAEIAQRFANYCTGTPIRFYSVEHFGTVFAGWKTPEASQRVTKDQAIKRALNVLPCLDAKRIPESGFASPAAFERWLGLEKERYDDDAA